MVDKFKISVITPNGSKLTYKVKEYFTLDGGLIKFFDYRLGKYKIFDSRLCEIEVLNNE